MNDIEFEIRTAIQPLNDILQSVSIGEIELQNLLLEWEGSIIYPIIIDAIPKHNSKAKTSSKWKLLAINTIAQYTNQELSSYLRSLHDSNHTKKQIQKVIENSNLGSNLKNYILKTINFYITL
jgi:hypothetical protein